MASLKSQLQEQTGKTEEGLTEVRNLRRQLEDAEFAKTSLERKLKSLEDEVTVKQVIIALSVALQVETKDIENN